MEFPFLEVFKNRRASHLPERWTLFELSKCPLNPAGTPHLREERKLE